MPKTVQINPEEQTETHLSKKYNDAVFDCMMKANMSSYINESQPHYEHLLGYIAAVDTFFINTYFLFENTIVNGQPLTTQMVEAMNNIRSYREQMKYDGTKRNLNFFREVTNQCRAVHMMIMYGLQKRKMLVRMSEREPRGVESVNYWDTKVSFKKGAVPLEMPGGKINDKKITMVPAAIHNRSIGWGRTDKE